MPRPRYTLRLMLVVTAIVAIVAWRQTDWLRQRREAIEAGLAVTESTQVLPQPHAPGLLWLFGEKGYALIGISHFPGGNAADRDRLMALFPEAHTLDAFPTPQ